DWLLREPFLDGMHAGERLIRTAFGEGDQETVADGLDLRAAAFLDRGPEARAMWFAHGPAVNGIAEGRRHPTRILDVGEDDDDSARGQRRSAAGRWLAGGRRHRVTRRLGNGHL